MKPCVRSLKTFAAWFINTSPEWVAPDARESTPARKQGMDPHDPPADDAPVNAVSTRGPRGPDKPGC